jgi:DNA mismatch repair protein MutL
VKTVENSVQNVEKTSVPDYRLIGEALKLYILVEVGGELLLIDKHAAHERMIFDRLKQQDRSVMAQTLLEGVTLRLDGEERELLEQNGALLNELGFELEAFGEDDYILRAVPADMEPGDARAAIEEILEKLKSGKAPDPASARDEILHTVACKAAIKAGWDTSRAEQERIVEEVLSGRVKYCPHGRPVSAVLTRKDLDKMFKRIV